VQTLLGGRVVAGDLRRQPEFVKRLLVAVDIGGSKIAILTREIGSERDVYAGKVKTPASDGVEVILRLLDAQIDNLPGGRSSMNGLGVAVPATSRTKVTFSAPVI
jgi:predicted NBD/HSP70 family sugar kinase